ncbi:MAG: protein kinase [Gemmataceae bacterium]|nr:protein kinase [Gemmataceae bacterium]
MAGSASESRSELVLELAEEFLDRYRRGERPPLKEYVDRHPELAAEIKEVFPAMAMMENIAVADSSLEGSEPDKTAKPAEAALKQLGDYRIIREIGHGGMGVVYEAEQVSLGRHVALKVLPNQALADAKHKRRFEREARAAAKLHHTNIVPVFGVGEHNGLPYYVMQFIQGLGLDVVLEELNRMQPGAAHTPTGLPTAGEIHISRRESAANMARSLITGAFQQTADDEEREPHPQPTFAATVDEPEMGQAAAAAPAPECPPPRVPAPSGSLSLSDSFTVSSSSITLPGNSAATDHRRAGKKQSYWQSVANIGRQVADALEYAHKQGILHRDIKPSNLLLDLRGTVWVTDFGLAKVAGPGGDNLTHTGDILGTLRYMPPEAFEGQSDARGDVYSLGLTMYELLAMRPAFDERDRNKLIKHVTTGEPTPLHKVNRETPRDLVTIIHKAIDREPSRRYATAEDLASDLQRFLDDEPILARRQTQLERYWRWARHNPGIAILGGVLSAVLVIVTLASLVVAGRMSTLADNEAQAAADERTARAAAVAAQDREAKERAKAEQAKKAAEDSKLRAEQALRKAEENFAKARAAVNDYLTAVSEDDRLKSPGLQGLRIQLLQSALQFYQEFLKERGDDPTLRKELAGVYFKVGEIHRELGHIPAAGQAQAQSRRLYEALAAEDPADPALQYGLAMSMSRLGAHTQAVAILEKLVQADDPKYLYELSLAYNSIAIGAAKMDKAKELEFLRKALGAAERLVKLRPDDADARVVMSASCNNIAIRIWHKHDAEALELLRRAAEEDEAAYRLAPNHPLAARFLTIGLNNVASTALRLGLTDEALAAHRRRVEVLDRRARDNPTLPGVDAALAGGLGVLLYELRQAGRWEEAARTADKARDRLAEATEETTEFFRQLSYFHMTAYSVAVARAKARPNEQTSTEPEAAAVVGSLRQHVMAGWRDPKWLRTDSRIEPFRQRADFKELLALVDELTAADTMARSSSASPDDKLAARQKMLTIHEALARPLPPDRFVRRNLAKARQELAQALLDAGRVDDARLAFDEAHAVRQQLLQEFPSNEQLRADLAQSQSAAGDLFAAAGKLGDAVRTWGQALATLEGGLKSNPNSIPFQTSLIQRLLHIADQYGKVGLWHDAAKLYRRAFEVQPPTGYHYWFFLANVLLETGDADGLQTLAKQMAARMAADKGVDLLHSGRIMLLMPDAAARYPKEVQLAAKVNYQERDWPAWCQGLAAVRIGQAAQALPLLEKVKDPLQKLPVQALALHQLGRTAAARQALHQADSIADQRLREGLAQEKLKVPDAWWADWLLFRHLRREAHQKIHGTAMPDSPYERLFRGRVLGALDEHDKGEAELTAAVAIRPDDADVWLTRSRIFAKLGRNDRMAADLLKAQQFKGDDPKTWIETGRMLAERGEHKQADVAFARAAALGKGELNRFLESGWWMVGPYPNRLEQPCPPELNPDPSKPVAAVGRAGNLTWQAVSTNAADGAINLQSVAAASGNASFYALAYVHADRDRTASLHFFTGSDFRLWVNNKLVFAGSSVQGNVGAWIPIVLRAGRNQLLLRMPGKFCECQFEDAPSRRAYGLMALGLWAEAAEAFAEADRRGPLEPWRTMYRTRCLLAVGKHDEARRVFGEAVLRHEETTNELARNHLGLACPLPPEKSPARDRRVALQLKLLDREMNAGKHYWLGHSYFRAARFDEAEKSIRQAIADGDRLAYYPLLASTLHYLGRADEARQVLDAAEQRSTALVKDALAAKSYHTPLDWYDELFFRSTLPEAQLLIRGMVSDPTADEAALLAKARRRLAELDKADDFVRLTETYPKQPRLWIDRGRRLGESGRWDEAARAFAKAAELGPKSPQVWKERGRAYAELGKWDEAAADFVKALDMAPPPKAKSPQFPWQLDRDGLDDLLVRWDEVFDRVTKQRPKDAVLWVRRAQHFARLGRWVEAEVALRRHHELQPQNHWNAYLQAPLLLQQGDVTGHREVALAMLQRFGGTTGWSVAEKVVGTVLLTPGVVSDVDPLQKMLDRVKDLKPGNLHEVRRIRLARALVAYRSGDAARAMKELTASPALTDVPSHDLRAEALTVLAMARHQLGQAVAARADLANALRTVDRWMPQPERGWLHADNNWFMWLRVALLIREAEGLIPPDPAVAAVETLSPQEAAARRDRKTRADRLAIQAALAQIRFDIGQQKAAEAELRAVLAEREKIAAEEPANPAYQEDLANAHHKLGQCLVNAGRVDEGVKETQQAVAVLEKLAASDTVDGRHHVNLAANLFNIGEFHWKAGRLAEGRKAWQGALHSLQAARTSAAKDPKLAKIALGLELAAGRAYKDLGLWTEASGHFGRAFDSDPVAGKVADHLDHALLLVMTGKVDEYRRYCLAQQESRGKNLNNWWGARMLTLRPGALPDPADVVDLAQEARTATPTNGWAVLHLALAQLRADQDVAALATFQEFEKISKGAWQFSWPALALARHRAGKIDEAHELLRKTEDWYAGTWTRHLAGDGTGLPKDGGASYWAFFLSLRQEAIETVTGKPPPADPWLHLHRARVYVKLGETKLADAEFQAAVQAQPDDPRIRLARGRIYAALGRQAEAKTDREQAIVLTEQALTRRPDDGGAADALAGLLLENVETKWTTLKPLAAKSERGATLTVQPDDSVLASGANPDKDVYLIETEVQGRVGAIRLEAIPDKSLPQGGAGRARSGNFALSEFRVTAGGNAVKWGRATADYSQVDLDVAGAIDSDAATGWGVFPHVAFPHAAVFVPVQPFGGNEKTRLTIRLAFESPEWVQHGLGRFRLSVGDGSELIQQSEWFQAASTPHAKVGAAHLARGDARRAADFLTKATAANPKLPAADWLVLALAHARLAETEQARKACARAAEHLKPTGAEAALRPLLREAVLAIGPDRPEAKELIVAAAGEPPAALTDAIQENPDQGKGYRDRGNWYAERGQWKAATADLTEAFRLEPTTFTAMQLGLLFIEAGEIDRYREHCRAILERWASTEKNNEADQSLKTCLLAAESKLDPGPLARLAEVAVSGDQNQDWYEWFLFAKGLHDYRTGKFVDALTACREIRRRAPEAKGQREALAALNLAVEAMALFRSGQTGDARDALSQAKTQLELHIPGIDSGGWWHDWLAARILYREAAGLIAGKTSERSN